MNTSSLTVAHPEARIGQNVTIDPFAVIEKDVVIGDSCHIYSHTVILDGARIGKNYNIFPGAVVAGTPQDMKSAGGATTAEVENNTTLHECVTINRDIASKDKIVVDRSCLTMVCSHVAYDCVLKNHIIIDNASQIAGEIEIDDLAIISGGSLVHQFTRISRHVMVQGGSHIGKDIPPYALIDHDPIVYCGINVVGLCRQGFTNRQAFLIQDIYRTLYTRSLDSTEALRAIETKYELNEERDLVLNSIKSSNRDIVRSSIDE